MNKISIKGGKFFYCNPEETILEAALRSGIYLNHSCLTGRCLTCAVRLIKGETSPKLDTITSSLKDQGQTNILTCVTKTISDIALEAEDLNCYGLTSSKLYSAKINKIEKLTDEISKFTIRVPPSVAIKFIPGQYLNVIRGGVKRSYSIANPIDFGFVELIIKNYVGGIMSEYWFNHAKENDLLNLEIPLGTFFIRSCLNTENLIFIATGTGIAPIKSIIESNLYRENLPNLKRIYIIWGMKYEHELFWQPSISEIDLFFMPTFSREKIKKSYAQDVLMELDVSFKKSVIYACGLPTMISEVKKIAIQKGVKEENVYFDAFVKSN